MNFPETHLRIVLKPAQQQHTSTLQPPFQLHRSRRTLCCLRQRLPDSNFDHCNTVYSTCTAQRMTTRRTGFRPPPTPCGALPPSVPASGIHPVWAHSVATTRLPIVTTHQQWTYGCSTHFDFLTSK